MKYSTNSYRLDMCRRNYPTDVCNRGTAGKCDFIAGTTINSSAFVQESLSNLYRPHFYSHTLFLPPFIRPVCTYCDRAKLVFAPTFSRFQYRNTDLFFISTHTQNLSINKNLNNNYLFKKSPFFQFSSVLMCHIIIYTSCTFVLFFSCLSEPILDNFVFHFVFSFDSPIVLCFLFIILCVFIHLLPHLCSRTVSFSTTFFSWCPLWKQ